MRFSGIGSKQKEQSRWWQRCNAGLHPEENFEFLVRSYQQLNADRVPHIKTKSGQLKPLADKENKRFLRLVRDYLELVDLI